VTAVEFAAYVACAAAAAALVYRYDLYDREPWPLLLATAAAGAVVMGFVGGVEDHLIARFAAAGSSPYPPAFIAATCEEGARLAVVAAVALLAPRTFNDPMDGLVYGSVAGIGMAIEESWVALGAHAGGSVSPAELVRLSGHLTMGGITGFGVGLVNRPAGGPGQWALPLTGCVVASIGLHFAWDVAALAHDLSGGLSWWPPLAASVVMLTGMGLFGALVVIGTKWSREAMEPGRGRSLWGWPFDRRHGRGHGQGPEGPPE
jgi:RsiW-degrading membrane proteinase PrsW (M82 family)